MAHAADGAAGRVSVAPHWRDQSAVRLDAADEVHVWRASLDLPLVTVEQLATALDDEERARAGRFHAERDRRRYIVAHAFMRDVLARYAGASTAALRFGTGRHGKPYLKSPALPNPLEFNLSHSGDLALLAVAWARPVGVDVEAARTGFDFLEVAEMVFSPAERRTLVEATGPARADAFYACWSRKEAYIKATGIGVAEGLDHFEVSLAPGAPAALLADLRDPAALQRWRLSGLEPGPGYAGAVAAGGQDWTLQCWKWSPAGGTRHSTPAPSG
jgi:4'-phosphopantetheinyl transferase